MLHNSLVLKLIHKNMSQSKANEYCKQQRVNLKSMSNNETQKSPSAFFFLIFSTHNFLSVSLTFLRDIIFLSSTNFSSDGLKGSGAPSETRL